MDLMLGAMYTKLEYINVVCLNWLVSAYAELFLPFNFGISWIKFNYSSPFSEKEIVVHQADIQL
jgi:hypothetical protein